MNRVTKIVVALLTIISIGVWGIAIFFFTNTEDSVPTENHALHRTQEVDKELIVYKNKQDNVQNQEIVNLPEQDLKKGSKANRVSIDELLVALTQEE